MTMQKKNTYIYNGDEYVLMCKTNKYGFKPWKYGLSPSSVSTDCACGYWCIYEIKENKFLLNEFFMYNRKGNYPTFNGVEVSPIKNGSYAHYENVQLPIKYTGKLLIARKYLYDEYSHYTAYPHAWYYEKLVELIFWRGRLIKTITHDDVAKKMRDADLNNDYQNFIKLFPPKKYWWIQKWKF